MKGSYVTLQIELDAIRNFLEHVNRDAVSEINNVLAKNDSGEFEDLDDFDNALYSPLMRQELAARAIYYELNALIERELQSSAHLPWLQSNRHRGPKSLELNNLTLDSVRSLKMVQDLPFREVVAIVEEFYGIKIKELEGGEAFLKMRDTVNAFKHRHGMIDFRKQPSRKLRFPEHHQADIEQAYEATDKTFAFIKALWQATDRDPPSIEYPPPSV